MQASITEVPALQSVTLHLTVEEAQTIAEAIDEEVCWEESEYKQTFRHLFMALSEVGLTTWVLSRKEVEIDD